MTSMTKEWLVLAGKDLKSAMVLIKEKDLANVILFHSQQCVEKSLKACLEQFGDNPPRIHNIQKLYSMVAKLSEFDSFMSLDDIDFLDSIYIDTRYPTGFGILPSGFPDIVEGQKGVEIAKRVYDFIMRVLENI